jgi:hypothetical protein
MMKWHKVKFYYSQFPPLSPNRWGLNVRPDSTIKPKSLSDRLNERMNRYPSESRISLVRNLAFGAAATALVVFSQLLQVGATTTSLEVSIVAASATMPLWIVVGSIYEMFILLGKDSYPYLRSERFRNSIGGVVFLAGLSLVIEIGAAAWYLSEIACAVFAGSLILSATVFGVYMNSLAKWWYSSAGPESSEPPDDKPRIASVDPSTLTATGKES